MITKEDCPDFELSITPQIQRTCIYYKGNYLCDLKKHFVCSPALKLLPPKLPTYLSYNQLSTFAACKMLYFLNYALKLDSTKKADYFVQGDIFHLRLKNYYTEGSTESVTKRDNENDVLAETMADLYCDYYPSDEYKGASIEVEKLAEIDGRQFKFIVDVMKDKEIVDHKLSGSVQSFLTTAFQGTIYLLAEPTAEKFTLNTTIKSQVECNKGLIDYASKIRASVGKKMQKHFIRLTYYRDELLSVFERQVNAIKFDLENSVKHLDDLRYFYMNPDTCNMISCDKQSICNNGSVSDKLYKVRSSNKEGNIEQKHQTKEDQDGS